MKTQAVLLLSLMVLGSVMTQDCSTTNNPFLAFLSGKVDSAVLLANAKTTGPFAVCSEVWNTANQVGTCCDEGKLSGGLQKQVDEAKGRWGAFMSSLNRVRKVVAKILKIKGNDASAQLDDMRKDATKFDLGGITNEQAATILDLASTFEARLATFKTEGKTCFKELATQRGKVFCYGCWAYGGSFFVKNGDGTNPPNFKMTPTSCNSLITACGGAWKFLFDTQVMMNLSAQLARKRMDPPAGASPPPPPANTPKMFNKQSLTPGEVKTAFDNCVAGSFALTNTCVQTNLQTLCQAFFSWAGKERAGREIKDEPAQQSFPTRLLQDTADDSAPAFDAAGADMTKMITVPTSNAELDTSGAGESPSSSAFIPLLALLLAFVQPLLL